MVSSHRAPFTADEQQSGLKTQGRSLNNLISLWQGADFIRGHCIDSAVFSERTRQKRRDRAAQSVGVGLIFDLLHVPVWDYKKVRQTQSVYKIHAVFHEEKLFAHFIDSVLSHK